MIICDGKRIVGVVYNVYAFWGSAPCDNTLEAADEVTVEPIFEGTKETYAVKSTQEVIEKLKKMARENNKYWKAENYECREGLEIAEITLDDSADLEKCESRLQSIGF